MSEELFVSQSAPTLAGIKTGNLFTAEFRSVYKELHADHETGAADNK